MGKNKIIGIVILSIAIIGLIFGINNIGESLPAFIVLSIIGLVLLIRKSKTKEEKQLNKVNAKKMMEAKINKFNAKHEAGLPISNGAECIITYNEDEFGFEGAGNTFNLKFTKITDICIKTDEEIKKQYVSSIGGAVAGNMLFGPLGTIVGGRAKEKKSTTITEYLIFTYLKDGKVDYISFNVGNNWFKAQKLVEKFNKDNKILNQGQTIEL